MLIFEVKYLVGHGAFDPENDGWTVRAPYYTQKALFFGEDEERAKAICTILNDVVHKAKHAAKTELQDQLKELLGVSDA